MHRIFRLAGAVCLPIAFAPPADGEILFDESFGGHEIDSAPGQPWTLVHDGPGIGTIRVRADTENFFGKGEANRFLEYRKDGTSGSMALRSLGSIEAIVSTFSIRFIETPDFEDFTWLILYAGSRTTGNRAQVIDLGRDGHLGRSAERGAINQVDLIVNNGDEPVSYYGIYAVAPGSVDIWVNGRPVYSNFSAQNNRRGAVTGFELNTSGARNQLLLIDEFFIREHPHVSGFEEGKRPFDFWRAARFSPAELEDPDISGPLADPSRDGIVNLQTYAFNLEPWTVAPRHLLPFSRMTDDGLALEFTRVKEAFDLRYSVETSEDLAEWFSGEEAVEEAEVIDYGDAERVIVLDKPSSNGDLGRRFIRLRVDLASPPSSGSTGEFENLGPPMETAPVPIESVTTNGAGQTIAWGTLVDADRFAVAGVDVDTGEAIELDLESYGRSSHIRIARGESGHLYIYAGNAARFFKYDIDEHQLIDLGRPASPARYFPGHAVSPDGRFYVGSYPATHLVSVDTTTDEIRHHGRMTDDERLTYIIRPAVSDDNIVYVPVGLHHAELWAYNPSNGEKQQILPASMMQDQGYTSIFLADDGHVYGQGFGQRFRCYPDRIEFMGSLPPPRDERDQVTAFGNEYREIDPLGNLAVFDTQTSQEYHVPTELRGQGVLIYSIGGIDGAGRLWGGGWSPARTWTYSLNTGQFRDWGKIVHPNTQVEATLIHPAGIFLSSYIGAHLDRFNPATETRTHITSFHTSHGQERLPWLITGNDGRIYGPLQPVKGHLDGGIARVDPHTLAHAAWTGFLEHLAPTTLAAVPGTDLLFGGTTIHGSTGAIPMRDEAVVFLWDTVQEEIVWHEAILPGETRYRVVGGNDGLMYGATGEKYFVFDPVGRELLHTGDLPPNSGFPNRYRIAKQPCGPEGWIVGLMKGLVFAIDPQDFSIRVVARHHSILEDSHEALHSTRAIWASPEGMLYYGSGSDLWRVDLTRQ